MTIKRSASVFLLLGSLPICITVSATHPTFSEKDLSGLSLYDLGQIVVTSTGFYDQTLELVPGSVIVLGPKELNHTPTTNLAELLQFYIPGVHVGATEQYGPSIGIRGIQKSINSETMVLFNGQSLNQHNFSGYTGGYLLPLLGDLSQVEVAKGPGTIVHGSGADAGYINLLPKNGTDNGGTFSILEYGFVDNLKKVEFGFGENFGLQHDLFLYAGVVQADGYNFDNDFGATSNPDFEFISRRLDNLNVGGFPKPSYKLSANYRHHNFSLTGLFQKVDFHPNSFVGRYDEDSTWHQTIFAVNPKYKLGLTDHESLELNAAFELTDFGIENRQTVPFLGENVPGADEGGSERHQELKLTLISNRFNQHRLALGFLAGYREFDDGEHFFSSTPAAPHFSAVNGEWDEYAFFIEDIVDINKSLSLTLGLRHDRINYSTIGSSFFHNAGAMNTFSVSDVSNTSYRAAIAYRQTAYTNIKLSYQSGFHYPDAAQYIESLIFSSELEGLGENRLSSLKPETVNSFQLNIENFSPQNKLKTNLNFYYNQHRDTLLFFNFRNATNRFAQSSIDSIVGKYFYFGAFKNSKQDFDSIGSEVSFTWRPTDSFTGNLSYGYSQPINVMIPETEFVALSFLSAGGDDWLAFPSHQVKASLDYRWAKWNLNLSTVYESAVNVEAPQAVSNSGIDDAYFRMNGLLEYQYSTRSTFYLLAKNIFTNETPPVSFINYRPFNGNLGTDERLVYFGYRYEY